MIQNRLSLMSMVRKLSRILLNRFYKRIAIKLHVDVHVQIYLHFVIHVHFYIIHIKH